MYTVNACMFFVLCWNWPNQPMSSWFTQIYLDNNIMDPVQGHTVGEPRFIKHMSVLRIADITTAKQSAAITCLYSMGHGAVTINVLKHGKLLYTQTNFNTGIFGENGHCMLCKQIYLGYMHIYSFVYVHFPSKVNIWNANCARATGFIFDTRTDIFCERAKVFERENVSTSEGLKPPT